MSATNLKVLIVEDNQIASCQMKRWLGALESVSQIETASSVHEAGEIIQESCPDAIFLDIELSDGSGFDLIDRAHRVPVVVMTGNADYAVQAFGVRAVDFLLKPFGASQVKESIRRIGELFGNLESNRDEFRIKIKDGGMERLIPAAAIKFISSEDYYCAIHTRNQTYLTRKSISELDRMLKPYGFLRIHRSTVVNLSLVQSTRRLSSGRLELVIEGDGIVTSSRAMAKSVLEAIESQVLSLG